MIVTRFNPTTNGNLHLGHIFNMIMNEQFAHKSDGRFIIRFDDTSPVVMNIHPDRRKLIMDGQAEDIKWLEVPVDDWYWQSKQEPEARELLEKFGHKFLVDDPEPISYLPLFTRMGTNWLPYPFVPQQTAERVAMDYMIGATHLIRGEEFSTEYSLYCYFCDQFGIPRPKFIYLPRLTGLCGDISKTNGGYTIAEMRIAGYTLDELKIVLAKGCLNWPAYGWEVYNVKPYPKIDL